jgi:hypothetical protein
MFDGLRLNLDGHQNCGDFINSISLTTTLPGTVPLAPAFRPAPDAMFEKMLPLQVLLVDDDVSVLGVLTGLLESLGHASSRRTTHLMLSWPFPGMARSSCSYRTTTWQKRQA